MKALHRGMLLDAGFEPILKTETRQDKQDLQDNPQEAYRRFHPVHPVNPVCSRLGQFFEVAPS